MQKKRVLSLILALSCTAALFGNCAGNNTSDDNTVSGEHGRNPLGKTIPIIAMTANAFSDDIQNSIAAGMDAHISKPIDVAILEKTMRGFLTPPNPQHADERL